MKSQMGAASTVSNGRRAFSEEQASGTHVGIVSDGLADVGPITHVLFNIFPDGGSADCGFSAGWRDI